MSRRHRSSHHPLLVPIALTLTAAVATAGLWFLSELEKGHSSDHDYPSSDEENDRRRRHISRGSKSAPGRPGAGRRRTTAEREHDRITEEDTSDFEEERRRDEEFIRRSGGRMSTMMTGAATPSVAATAPPPSGMPPSPQQVTVETLVPLSISTRPRGSSSTAREADIPSPAALPTTSTTTAASVPPPPAASAPVASNTGNRYIPPPKKNKIVAIVVSERRAITGHESDEDFEEAGLPSSLLSRLPDPLNLPNTDLFILIHSPHLPSHPLSEQHPRRRSDSSSSDNSPPRADQSTLTIKAASPTLSRAEKSSYDLALELLPKDAPRERIMPFTERESLVPMLRQIGPMIVYLEESLCGDNGEAIPGLLDGGWVREVVVVVGIGEVAGLMSDDDVADTRREKRWWEKASEGVRAKYGRRVEIVEAWVLEEDWARRMEVDEEH